MTYGMDAVMSVTAAPPRLGIAQAIARGWARIRPLWRGEPGTCYLCAAVLPDDATLCEPCGIGAMAAP